MASTFPGFGDFQAKLSYESTLVVASARSGATQMLFLFFNTKISMLLNLICYFLLSNIYCKNIKLISQTAFLSPYRSTQIHVILSHHPLPYGCIQHHAQHPIMNRKGCQANQHFSSFDHGLSAHSLKSFFSTSHFKQSVVTIFTCR